MNSRKFSGSEKERRLQRKSMFFIYMYGQCLGKFDLKSDKKDKKIIFRKPSLFLFFLPVKALILLFTESAGTYSQLVGRQPMIVYLNFFLVDLFLKSKY